MPTTAPEPLSPAADLWVNRSLAAAGARLVGQPVLCESQPWSTVWSVPTDQGTVWLKQSRPTQAAEGSVHAAIAGLAPAYVDAPLALDPANRWMLTPDGGATITAAAPDTQGVDEHTLAGLLADYAQMQRATIGHRARLVHAGIRVLDPCDAAGLARDQADYLAHLPADDPRHLTDDQRDQVIRALPDLAAAGSALADGPVPQTVDQCDLWPRNVFVPRPDGRHRFFDFADAAWSHPFTSLVMIAAGCPRQWKIDQPQHAVDLRHRRLRTVFDAYLTRWTDFAPLPALRELAQHALRIAPLHRSSVWLQLLHTADAATVARHGTTPWAWLQDVAKPVHL